MILNGYENKYFRKQQLMKTDINGNKGKMEINKWGIEWKYWC